MDDSVCTNEAWLRSRAVPYTSLDNVPEVNEGRGASGLMSGSMEGIVTVDILVVWTTCGCCKLQIALVAYAKV